MTAAEEARMRRQTAALLSKFRSEFQREVPDRIHNRDIADDGSPQWSDQFRRWMTDRGSRDDDYITNPEHRLRTTRAMRRLRKFSTRSFEVTYRQLLGGEPISKTRDWLNERAIRNQIPLPNGKNVHYTEKDVVVILFSGLDLMLFYY